MNKFSFNAYLRYRKKAKGRHDIHSPFVFSFVEEVLRKKQKKVLNFNLVIKQSNALINRIANHYNCQEILWLSNQHIEEQTFISIQSKNEEQATLISKQCNWENLSQFPKPDLVLLDINDPQEWQPAFEKLTPFFKKESIVILPSIHQSEWHEKNWEQIARKETVKLSLDLFRIGLLFFREEFLVKQHFVLK
jgi:hypothetical protein